MNETIGARQASRPRRVLVADRDPNVRAALRLLLARHPNFWVVAESQDLAELLRDAVVTQPDLILLDWELSGLHADGRLAKLRGLRPTAAIIALSTRDEQCPRALHAGCAAFVVKGEAPARLLAALAAAASVQSPSSEPF